MQSNPVGIIGCGFVGGAMQKSLEKRGQKTVIYDKYKELGSLAETLTCDIIFLCLPTPFVEGFGYDLGSIKDTCTYLKANKYNGVVVVKSTVEPGTCQDLANHYNLCIFHNPEFLTARTAFEDLDGQKHIVIGTTRFVSPTDGHWQNKFVYPYHTLYDFYHKLYPEAEISTSTSEESELMKLFCNNFYAVKVQLFNEFYFVSQKMNADFEKVKAMMFKNGWINPMHTKVPGPDGKFSFSGSCFPKDTGALNHFMKTNGTPHEVLEAAIKERNSMRKD